MFLQSVAILVDPPPLIERRMQDELFKAFLFIILIVCFFVNMDSCMVLIIVLASVLWSLALCMENSIENTNTSVIERFRYLKSIISSSILVHMHIPKAGGTALALALSSNCDCKVVNISGNTESKPSCTNCDRVKSEKYDHIYTINRATGWKCGVHPPLSVMEYLLEDDQSSISITKKGFHPVYIIMLREPFDRFISESLKWTDLRGHAVDWSMTVHKTPTPNKKLKKDNLSSISFPPNVEILMQYAKQDDEKFILPNRQVKMIGGVMGNFDMTFKLSKRKNGSRWISSMNSTTESLLRAKLILANRKDVIFGIYEQFEEFLCMLELLFGEKFSFKWYPDVHSHNQVGLSLILKKKNEINVVSPFNSSMLKPQQDYNNYRNYQPLANIWMKHNHEDIELHLYAVDLFQHQFQLLIDFVKEDIERYHPAHFPHCRGFI